jgi:hypothetical protein
MMIFPLKVCGKMRKFVQNSQNPVKNGRRMRRTPGTYRSTGIGAVHTVISPGRIDVRSGHSAGAAATMILGDGIAS